jgi:hypothetical protein
MKTLELQRRRFSNEGETQYDKVDVFAGDKRSLESSE